jgi:dihydrofolate synthase/folylpolyglutamate synthase
MYTQSAEVMEVFIKKCREVSATLVATTETIQKQEAADILDHSMPLFQQRNWLLAYYVFRHVLERDNLSLPPATDIAKTQSLQIPARMDIKKLGEKTLVVDGAHNEQKMQAFVSSFQAKFSGKKASLLFSLKQGKDYSVIIDIILPIISSIIVTTFETSQDLPVVSMDPEVLARYLREHGAPNVTVQPDHHTAYHELLNSDEDILIVTGSFYLIYQIRNEEYLA